MKESHKISNQIQNERTWHVETQRRAITEFTEHGEAILEQMNSVDTAENFKVTEEFVEVPHLKHKIL